MKADACVYGDAAAMGRKGSKRAAGGAQEADDADEGTPGHTLENGIPAEATPFAASSHGQFEYLGNGDSAGGTATLNLYSERPLMC